jgi:hypothetical protein
MKSTRSIYLLIALVFLLIIAGLIYRFTKKKDSYKKPESHMGYPY